MKNGKLNNRERQVLLRAEEIVNNLIDWHEENEGHIDDYDMSMLYDIAGGLDQYICATRGE